MLPCAYKLIFGIDCPLCGFQRALLLLGKGYFLESLKTFTPLIPILILILAFFTKFLYFKIYLDSYLKKYSLFVLTVILINFAVKIII